MNEKKYVNKNQKRNAFGNLRSAKSLKWGLCNIGCNLSTWANYKSTGRPWSCSVLPWSTVSRCEDTLRSPGCVPGWTGSCSPLIVPPGPPRSMTLCCSRRMRTGSARWTRWGSMTAYHSPVLLLDVREEYLSSPIHSLTILMQLLSVVIKEFFISRIISFIFIY